MPKKKKFQHPRTLHHKSQTSNGSTIWYQRGCLLFQQDFESVLHTLIRLCVCCIFHITWQQFPQISKLHVCHMYSQFIYFSPCTYQRCFYKLEITASFFIAIYKKLKKNLAFIIPQKLWSETECKCTKWIEWLWNVFTSSTFIYIILDSLWK